MQYSLTTIISATLLLSTVSALPATSSRRATPNTANIQIKTGDGDASVQRNVKLGSLQTKDAQSGGDFGDGVNAFVVNSGVTCQAFADATGKTKLGGTFTNTITASFTNASNGGVDSNASDAVTIAALCCAVDANFAKDCGNLGSNNGNGSGKGKTVRVQIDEAGDESTQGEVPVDGSLYVLSAALDGKNALDAFIVDTEGAVNPSCQAFADENGTTPVGPRFSTVEAQLGGMTVQSLICKES
jgi:hypothetical protein